MRGYTSVCVNSYTCTLERVCGCPVRSRLRVCVRAVGVYPHRRGRHSNHGSPATARFSSRAHTGLVGGVRSGARAHQGLAPFLHRYPPPPPLLAHRHAFRLSLKPDRTARGPSLLRPVFSPVIPSPSLSLSFLFPPFLFFRQKDLYVPHDNFG